MKEIQLTQGKIAIVDDEDFGTLTQWNWIYRKRQTGHSPCGDAIRCGIWNNKKNQRIAMSRQIMNVESPFIHVDHINHDTLDNRRANLRLVTHQQNQFNRGASKNSTSIFKGVSWWKKQKKWGAQIGINGTVTHLGFFEIEEDAARAYDLHASKLHGEFAYLNFPVE